jgi:hypothetical protein
MLRRWASSFSAQASVSSKPTSWSRPLVCVLEDLRLHRHECPPTASARIPMTKIVSNSVNPPGAGRGRIGAPGHGEWPHSSGLTTDTRPVSGATVTVYVAGLAPVV